MKKKLGILSVIICLTFFVMSSCTVSKLSVKNPTLGTLDVEEVTTDKVETK